MDNKEQPKKKWYSAKITIWFWIMAAAFVAYLVINYLVK